MSPRTNCCTAKLSWDFLLLQNGRLLYWIYFRNTARLLKLRDRRRERSALFLFDKVSYNARYMKIRGVKNASFPGFGPFRLQRPVFASSVCLVCICVLLCFTPVSCVYFYFLWLLFVFAFYSYIIAAKSKSVPSACSGFPLERFSSI